MNPGAISGSGTRRRIPSTPITVGEGDFPVAESHSRLIINLPPYPKRTKAEQDGVCECLGAAFTELVATIECSHVQNELRRLVFAPWTQTTTFRD